MAIATPRELRIGAIIDKTLGVVERCLVPCLVFFVVLTALNLGIDYVALGRTAPLQQLAFSLLKSVVAVVPAYLLLGALLRRTGLLDGKGGDTFLPYFGLSILQSLGVVAGFILIIIPGLFLLARWSVAQPLLVARGRGIREALGESWERTSGNDLQILTVILVLIVPLIAISALSALMLGRDSLTGMIVTHIAGSVVSVLFQAMGVALLGMIEAADRAAEGPRIGA